MNPMFKTCPRCQTDVLQDTPRCPRCDYQYRTSAAAGAASAPAKGEKGVPLPWLLAILLLLAALVGGVLLFAASDTYPFLGTWVGEPMQAHSAPEIRLGKDGIAETNFRFQDDLTPLLQTERSRRYRWTNVKNTIVFLPTTTAEKTGFRVEWKISVDGKLLALTGTDVSGRQGTTLTMRALGR